jgi:aminoglycoside 6-adenylyltransferase
MSKTEKHFEQLIDRFTSWAQTRSDIRAAVIVGSRSRVDHPADEWADLDIIVVTTDPKRYTSKADWIENVGNPLLTFIESTGTGEEKERRVLFEGMLDVDFAIFPEKKFRETAQLLVQKKIPSQVTIQISNVFGRGMRILVDKDGMLTQLKTSIPSLETPSHERPTEHEFSETVNDFLYHAVFTAKHLLRGELWWTVTCLNCHMQWLMCRMMEWHAKVTYGWNHDTWFRGRFLEEWAHPRDLKGLQSVFTRYDYDDTKHALLEAMHIFSWMAMETAEKLSYLYPTKADKHITEWIGKRLSEEKSVKQ